MWQNRLPSAGWTIYKIQRRRRKIKANIFVTLQKTAEKRRPIFNNSSFASLYLLLPVIKELNLYPLLGEKVCEAASVCEYLKTKKIDCKKVRPETLKWML